MLTVCLMLGVMPLTAWAAQSIPSDGQIVAPGLYDISTATGGATVTVTVNGVALTGIHTNLSVVINPNITLTLKDAHITRAIAGNPLQAGGQNCGLILAGDNSVTGSSGYTNSAGVNVPATASIIIEGTGKLTAQGGGNSAGIGGNNTQASGAITIQHATIDASGNNGGSGVFDRAANQKNPRERTGTF